MGTKRQERLITPVLYLFKIILFEKYVSRGLEYIWGEKEKTEDIIRGTHGEYVRTP